ncbi:hypothetical protein VTN02DRAFT_5233 [Thermoascus thermophilus]
MLQTTIADMPDGLETIVGAGGSALSGGQRQRVAIARARLRDTPILILDESTSALDYASRTAVMQAIRTWRRGKTTIIITHDVSQILEDDFFYVLDHGRVVSSGYRKAPFLGLEKRASTLDEGDDHPSVADGRDSVRHSVPDSDAFSIRSLDEKSLDVEACSGQTHLPATSTPEKVAPEASSPYSGRRISTLPSLEVHDRGYGERVTGTTVDSVANAGASRYPQSVSSASKPSTARDRRRRWKKRHDVPSISRILLTIVPHLTIPQRVLLILGFACALMHATATPIFAYLLAQLLDTFSLPENRAAAATKWSLAVLGLAVCDATVSYLMHYLLESSGQAWVDALRRQAMGRILDRPRSWFEREENQPAQLTACLDRHAEETRDLVGRFAGFALVAVTIVGIAVTWSFVVCWKMTLVGLSCGPILYGIIQGFERVSGKWERRANDVRESASSIFSETFVDLRTVRSLTLESYFHRKHLGSTARAMRVGLQRAGYTGVLFGLAESAIMFASGEYISISSISRDIGTTNV